MSISRIVLNGVLLVVLIFVFLRCAIGEDRAEVLSEAIRHLAE